MIAKYYKILGVPTDATFSEVKDAYRSKAKKLHPDVNKAPDAHEQFVELNEAYEYLEKRLTGKMPPVSKSFSGAKTRARAQKRTRPEEEWSYSEREQARRRARYYAKMRYEDFTSSDYYQRAGAFNVFFDHVVLLGVFGILLASPMIAFFAVGWMGFSIAMAIIIITFPGWMLVLKGRNISPKQFIRSVRDLSKSYAFIFGLTLFLNVVMLFYFILHTFMEVSKILLPYGLTILLGMILYKISFKEKRGSKSKLLSFGILPTVVSMFFLLNHVFASEPKEEHYQYRPYQNTTLVRLKDDQYGDYAGVRFFLDSHAMRHTNYIKLEIREGLFAIDVLTDYEFYRYHRRK